MSDVTLVGTGGTMPYPDRHLASFIMRHDGASVLIDCGEGTQISLKKCRYTFRRIDTILLTHFHADHVSGLPGLLLTMGNEGRTEPVTIAGPEGTEQIVNSLRVIAPELPFEIKFVEWSGVGQTLRFGEFAVTAFPLDHIVPCFGYRIEIPRVGKFDVEKATENNVPVAVWSKLQKQPAAEYEGVIYSQDMVMGPQRRGISVCYATDTRPVPVISEMAKDADLFVAEGMFADEQKHERAEESHHMTFAEAAKIAAEAKPKRFWLTHFSPSLHDPENYLDQVREIYPDTVVGYDGMREEILFDNQ